MTADILDPTAAQQIVFHAEASRYSTIAGFTILILDHLCTLDEEIRLMWTAPRSLVKILFLGNRYITPIFMAVTVYEMSRLAVFSNTFCKWWTTANGFAEISSMAISDLLLLFRVHALWEGRRSVVIGTYSVYAFAYLCIMIVGSISAFEMIPMLHYDSLARICASEFRPKVMPALWSVSLLCEFTVFIMTAIKAFEHRTSGMSQNPLLKTLYYDQFLYYIIIILVRISNLFIWLTLPQSLFFLGLYTRLAHHAAPSECGLCAFSTIRYEFLWGDRRKHSYRMGEAKQWTEYVGSLRATRRWVVPGLFDTGRYRLGWRGGKRGDHRTTAPSSRELRNEAWRRSLDASPT